MSNEPEGLQTVKESGRAVPRRITSAAAARTIYKDFQDDDNKDAYRRSVIQGMIDGNQPYDPEVMKEQGLAQMVNVNFLSMRANLDARASAAHEIFAEVPTLVELRPKVDDGKDPNLWNHCSIIAEEFTNTVRDWKKFLPYMDQVFRESDAYGLGVCLFQDEYDWHFKSFRRGSLLFDSEASVDVSENDVYLLRDSMSAVDLLERIEGPGAEDSGWNINFCRKLLVDIFIKGSSSYDEKYRVSTWESLQQMKRNNDAGYQSKQFSRIPFVHVLSRESASGKITHQMMAEKTLEKDAFMFERADRFDSMDAVLWWLPFNYADGYARSIRGVASYMAMHDDLSNRFLCRVFDAGFLSSSILLQPATQTDLGRLDFLRIGPYTVLPPELKTIQSTFQPQIAPLIQLREVSENVLKNNTGMYRQHAETFSKASQPKTARQVMEESSKEARYEKAAVAHRYDHLDILYRRMLSRMLELVKLTGEGYKGKEEADDFVKRCVARGVPRKLVTSWEDKLHMHATRALGLGSPAVRHDLTNQLLQARGLMDEQGQINAFRDWLAARVSYLNVDRYRPMVNRNDIPSNEHSIAALENNDMSEGVAVVVGSDQLHFIHVNSHLGGVVIPTAEAAEAGEYQDPMAVAQRLSVAIQHVSGHLEYLSQDEERKDFVKQVTDVLKKAMAFIPKLQAHAQQIAKQAQAEQAQRDQVVQEAENTVKDRELEAKIFEIVQKSQLERMKQESLNAARAEKTDEQMQIRRNESAAGIQLRQEKQDAELAIARQKVNAQ
jgi:hypothetical protein